MLEKILQNQIASSFILVVDDEQANGISLLYMIMKNFTNSISKIHVACYENNPNEIQALVGFNLSKLVLHDFYSDPLGWNNEKDVVGSQDVSNIIETDFEEKVVVFDSLSPLLQSGSLLNCSRMLQRLKHDKNIKCIVALFHLHLHSSHTKNAISYLANTVIRVTIENQKQLLTNALSQVDTGAVELSKCSIVHQKPNGKVVTSDEEYKINCETLDIQISAWNPFSERETKQESQESSTFDESNVTFSLNLSKEEEAQRKKLIMPYTKVELEENDSGGGQIFYEPDESDLYEDDPDEDLDF